MNLRDMDEDCKHGNTREHYPAWDGSGEKGDESCPGGREVTAADITEMAHSLWQAEQMDEYHGNVL